MAVPKETCQKSHSVFQLSLQFQFKRQNGHSRSVLLQQARSIFMVAASRTRLRTDFGAECHCSANPTSVKQHEDPTTKSKQGHKILYLFVTLDKSNLLWPLGSYGHSRNTHNSITGGFLFGLRASDKTAIF